MAAGRAPSRPASRSGVSSPIAPTTILGGSARYSLGDLGSVNLIGIYQYEQTAFNRPPLGFEPEATLVGGINTELHFRPMGVTRFLNSLTTGGATSPSRLDLTGELALTRPDPNRAGAAYLEEFEIGSRDSTSRCGRISGNSAAGPSCPMDW